MAAERLGALVRTEEQRQAIKVLAMAGAGIGKYPKSPSGIDYVYLEGERFTDEQLAHLRQFDSVKQVTFDHSNLKDEGLRYLSKLRQLKSLSLNHTGISDAGLIHVEVLVKLKWIDLSNTKVTRNGIARLQKALPKTKIYS